MPARGSRKSTTKSVASTHAEVAELDFRAAQQQLDTTLVELQSEQLPLEQLPELYAKAMALEQHCRNKLEQVVQDIQQLDPDSLTLTPLEAPEA